MTGMPDWMFKLPQDDTMSPENPPHKFGMDVAAMIWSDAQWAAAFEVLQINFRLTFNHQLP